MRSTTRPGDRYGRWTILEKIMKVDKSGGVNRNYLCKCDCGNVREVPLQNMKRGISTSCGCARREANTKPDNYSAKYHVMLGYKHSAKKKNLDFSLSQKEFFDLLEKNCFYCGVGPSNLKINYSVHYYYNGIDRINSTLGYISSNVVTCCKMCNFAKRDCDKDVFLKWVEKTYLNLKEKGEI